MSFMGEEQPRSPKGDKSEVYPPHLFGTAFNLDYCLLFSRFFATISRSGSLICKI